MAKVSVKLKHPAGRLKNDQGKQFEAHKVYTVEASERITKAIEMGVLEKVSKGEAEAAPVEESLIDPPPPPADNKSGNNPEKKNN